MANISDHESSGKTAPHGMLEKRPSNDRNNTELSYIKADRSKTKLLDIDENELEFFKTQKRKELGGLTLEKAEAMN